MQYISSYRFVRLAAFFLLLLGRLTRYIIAAMIQAKSHKRKAEVVQPHVVPPRTVALCVCACMHLYNSGDYRLCIIVIILFPILVDWVLLGVHACSGG